ncbi:MAG: hypothetical protein IPJ32_09410 [Sphingobacteriaceae bacterium]|nr:hypothetical protein [Sphingobacteriaceae bacterium]
MKKITFLVLFVGFLLGCKKEENTIVPSEGIQNSPHSVSTATAYSGFFTSVTNTFVFSHTVTIEALSEVHFNNAPADSPQNCIKVGDVKLNGTSFLYDSIYRVYRNNTSSNLGKEVWEINGGGDIPSFNFINNATPPNCQSYVLPDSVSISSGITINIPGANNITTGSQITIYDNNFMGISKPIVNGNNSVFFSSSELWLLSLSGDGYISLDLQNVQNLNFYGKDFKFVKQKGFLKLIKFMP